jgi:NTP pyrophosphatase (non-canonical NTP hydrolase)
MKQSLAFDELRKANTQRCNERFHPVEEWTPSDWGNAMAGEFGEVASELSDLFILSMQFFSKLKACDTIKKMLRQMEGDARYEELKKKLALELADVVIYADLLSVGLGIDLGESVRNKFNEVSVKRNSEIRL